MVCAGPIRAGQGQPQGVRSSQQIAAKPLCQALAKAGNDSSVKAVVVRIDSPGELVSQLTTMICILDNACLIGKMLCISGSHTVLSHVMLMWQQTCLIYCLHHQYFEKLH